MKSSVTPAAFNAAIENSFFLIWTCVAVLFSVYLYERVQHNEFRARVSERQARQQLEASNRKLLELDHLKSEFFANISHELRTPLTLCLGTFRTLFKLAPSPESRELAHTGTRNASRLLFLINELLDLARFDSGRAKLTKQWFNLCALVRNVAEDLEDRIATTGASLDIARLPVIAADSSQVRQLFQNLLVNSLKFVVPGRAPKITISSQKVGAWHEITIADNGIGFDEVYLDRIFKPFQRLHKKEAYEGTGIGLAICQKIVQQHGGTITARSRQGEGATFVIRLPATKAGKG